MMKRHSTAFTLTELLVVVAVIGVLSSIAVPQFSNALIRSKVARVHSDHMALQTAIELYRLDYQTVLPTEGAFDPSYFDRLRPLTTPVAYMSRLPADPFQPMESSFMFAEEEANRYENRMYVYNRGDVETGISEAEEKARISFTWSLASTGPDSRLLYPYYYYPSGFVQPQWYQYHPSNGIVSGGEIFHRSINSRNVFR